MRISAVNSLAKNFNKNINFTRFSDDNARNAIRKTLSGGDQYDQMRYDWAYESIKNSEFTDVYTDKDGKVKYRFLPEVLNKFSSNDSKKMGKFEFDIDWAKKRIRDLRIPKDAEELGRTIDSMNETIAGRNTPTMYTEPFDDGYDAEAEFWARIDNLAK